VSHHPISTRTRSTCALLLVLSACARTPRAEPERRAALPRRDTTPAAQAAIPPPSAAAVVEDVQRIEDTIEVQRSVLNRLFERSAWGDVRVVPVLESDVANGMRLFGVRQGTPLDDLGLMNGDQILRVAEHPVHELATLLALRARVATRSELELGLIRRGMATTIHYRIVP
jgi:S1-C subfamily serine protease